MKFLPDTTTVQSVEHDAAASGSDAEIALAADSDHYHVIDWCVWSYDSAPSSGLLTIQDTTLNAVLTKIHITAAGPGGLFFSERGLRAPKGSAITITLDDGSAAKHLQVQYR